jgi:hypothetical protein
MSAERDEMLYYELNAIDETIKALRDRAFSLLAQCVRLPPTTGWQTGELTFASRVVDSSIRRATRDMRAAISDALHELGEPQPGYPAPVANAVQILRDALNMDAGKDLRTALGASEEGKPDCPRAGGDGTHCAHAYDGRGPCCVCGHIAGASEEK